MVAQSLCNNIEVPEREVKVRVERARAAGKVLNPNVSHVIFAGLSIRERQLVTKSTANLVCSKLSLFVFV